MRISDKVTEQIIDLRGALPAMSESEVRDTVDHAASDFASYTLWDQLPADTQGDRTSFAVDLRKQRAAAARDLWLAATIEESARRRIGT